MYVCTSEKWRTHHSMGTTNMLLETLYKHLCQRAKKYNKKSRPMVYYETCWYWLCGFNCWSKKTHWCLWTRNNQGAFVRIVDRYSKYAILGRIPKATAHAASEVIIRRLKRIHATVHTLTKDDGKEFHSLYRWTNL